MSGEAIRIVFLSDTHLGFDYPLREPLREPLGAPIGNRAARRRRGQDFFDNYQRVLDYAVDSNADLVIHGGDFFFRSKVPAHIVDLAYDRLVRFADHGIPIYIVPGNHERSVLPPSLFLSHPHIHVFDRPRTFSLQVNGIRLGLSGFPNERDHIRKQFRHLVEDTRWRECSADVRLLCIHQTVEGSRVGPSGFTFRLGADVIPRRDLPNEFDGVLSGHIHRHQVLSGAHPPVIYPGSVERTSFAEKNEIKGFLELHINRRRRETKIDYTFNLLPSRPMVDIVLGEEIGRSTLHAYLTSRVGSLDDETIVRLTCTRVPSQAVLRLLAREHLRRIFPPTMNVQLHRRLFAGSGT